MAAEGNGEARTTTKGGDSIMPRKPRRRSWGSITEVTKGKKYVLRWVENTPQGRRRKCETIYGTYREADRRLSEIRLERGDDGVVPTFGDVSRTWYLPWLSERVESGKTKRGTFERYTLSLERDILPRWSKTPVDSIKPLDVQNWLMSLSRAEANLAIVVCRKVMDFAVQYEIAETNKFRMPYEMPNTIKEVRSTETYSLLKASEMFERLRGTMCEASFILACFGSARLGESLGVMRHEVEREDLYGMTFAVVPIVRRVLRTGSDVGADGDLKSKQSERFLVIPEPYGTRLLEIAENGTVPGSKWLAPQHNGETMSCGQLGWYWRKASGDDHIPFKNLRTSWRTFAQYEWGIDYDTCELLMGHKIPGVTGSHYLKPSREQLVEKFASELAFGKN